MKNDLISRKAALDAHCELCPDQYICCPVRNGNTCYGLEVFKRIPPAHRDDRLNKIAELVEGTIDHFDREDAMDLLYQIKGVLK